MLRIKNKNINIVNEIIQNKKNKNEIMIKKQKNKNEIIQKQIIQKQIIQKQNFKLFYNKKFESVIPLKIYQAWHSNDIPNYLIKCINNIQNNNPEFEYFLYNDNSCREFIKNNFEKEVLDAYDSLIPYAFKIDLWRYCVLYKNGGIYLDIKYFCINNFKFKYLTDKEYFCRDLKISGEGIYNALIICKPNNEIMLKCIMQIVENVKNNYYGNKCLEPTGPLMIKKFISNKDINNLDLSLNFNKKNKNYVYVSYNNLPILCYLSNIYRQEQKKYQKHYSILWSKKNIYKNKNNNSSLNEVFTNIYEKNIWGNNNNNNYKGSSGSGSSIKEQINTYVPFLISFIQQNNINSIVDLGCGDFIVGKIIYNNLNIKYYGYDTYKKIIDYHNKTNIDSKYTFIFSDFYKDKTEIINADLCIIKDVIMHWSLEKIYTFLDYIIESNKFKYILIINDNSQKEDNTDINDGEFRPLSANFYPLKKYNPIILYKYQPCNKEISLITI